MAHSSILGVDRAPVIPRGHDLGALGPSDSSDSGSDVQGYADLEETERGIDELQRADSDAASTGEGASAIPGEDWRDGGDIAPDRIVDAAEALGPENVRAAARAQALVDELAENKPDTPLDCAEWMEDHTDE